MIDDVKPSPDTLDQPDRLRVILARAASGDIDEDLLLSMRVVGGVHSQSYRFQLIVSGRGDAHCELQCRVTGRQGRVHDVKLEPRQVIELSQRVYESGILDVAPEPPRFLPDTIVGVIEISNGVSTLRVYFAADPDQAAAQDRVPPEAVRRTAEAMYSLGRQMLGLPSAEP